MSQSGQSTVNTRLWLMDRSVSPHVALRVPLMKGMGSVGGGKRKKIDSSTMDSIGYNDVQGGRADPPESQGELLLIKSLAGHQALKHLAEKMADGTIANTQAVVLDSDGTGNCTVVTDVLTPPTTGSPKVWACSGDKGSGYISIIPQSKYADDEVIRADFAFQWSGKVDWFVKGEIISKIY